MDITNIGMIPTWGLIALGLSLLGTLAAGAVGFRIRRVPAWTLGLVPLAGAAAWAASMAPTTMATLAVGLASIGLAVAQLLAGVFGLAPEEARRDG